MTASVTRAPAAPPSCGRSSPTVSSDAGLLAEEWKAIGKIFILAIILDVVYQLMVLPRIYPVEAIDVALLLAVLPYALLRGLVNRLARR